MAVKVKLVSDSSEFEFTCAQWALMSDASKADWTVTENTCGIQTGYGNPYAATDLLFTLNGVVGADSPITLTLIDGVYTVGISPASADGPGSMSVDDWLKAQAYLEPVSLNTISSAIPAGAVTSISVATALLANEYVAGDVFSVVNNDNGERVKLTVTASTTAGATTIAVSGTAADEIPIGGILVPIFSVRQILTAGTGISITSGVIANTAPDQVVSLTAGSNISITGTYPNFTIAATGSSGTVTSVGLSLPSIFSVSGSPVTTSGTLTGTLANQSANVVFAGPTTGGAAAPTFRALVTADLANDLVTYAKIQNVSATSRILGRVTAGAGDIEELTVAQVQTLLGYIDGSLTNPRIPYASDANTLIDSGNLRWLNGTKEIIVGDGASLNARFSHAEVASIAGNSVFALGSNNVSGNYLSGLFNTRNLAGANAIQYIAVGGANAGDPILQFIINGVVTHAIGTDNSDQDKFKITPNSATPGGNANSGLVITNALVSLVGINKDAPAFPIDVGGRGRVEQYIGINVAWGVGDVFFGTGAGTAPTFTSMTGTHNWVRLAFKTGAAPTANNVVLSVVRKAGFEFAAKGFPVFCAGNAATANEITKFYMGGDNGVTWNLVANGSLTASTDYEIIVCFSGY